jgi:hypothetical protein
LTAVVVEDGLISDVVYRGICCGGKREGGREERAVSCLMEEGRERSRSRE